MKQAAAFALFYALAMVAFGALAAEPEQCIAPAELQATRAQREQAQNDVAAIRAAAVKEIERLQKRVEELTPKPEAKPK